VTTKTKKPAAKKPEPLKQTSKDFRLISRDQEKMPVELSQAERDRCAIQLAELVEEKEGLDEEKREVMREWRVKLRAKQEEIDDCAAGVIRGAKPTAFTIETRAVFKSRMIERVRTEDGKLVEKRPMTPEEEVQYLQTDISDGRAAPHTLNREPGPDVKSGPLKLASDGTPAPDTLVYSTGPDEPTEEEEVPELDDDTRAALGGLPKGWRKVWLECQWRIEGDDKPLRGGDLFEVYLRIKTQGSSTAEVTPDFLSTPHVQRALDIMRRRGLVRTDEGGLWFVAEEAPEVPTEPGRNDPLPEAAEVKKPKRRGARDTGEQAINVALGQSEGHVH
jgi:hypothetical protein